MLEILQTGKVLYVLAAVCGLGILSKLVTSRLYKRLIKETGNMALTKNKNLKALKQKTENMFLLNHGIRNTTAYIEKQIYGFRFMKISLDNWDNLSMQAMILSFLIGGVAAFGAYWFRSEAYYIVLYGSMGILSGLFLVFVDNGANIAVKRQQLSDCLVDYVENSPHFYKNVDKSYESANGERKTKAAAARPRLHEVRKNMEAAEETAAGEESGPSMEREEVRERTSRLHTDRSVGRGTDRAEARKLENTETARNERQGGRFSVLSKKKSAGGEAMEQEQSGRLGPHEDELAKSVEQLRQSLEQIAAGKELSRREMRDSRETRAAEQSGAGGERRELRPEDLRVLGELLQEYLT